LVLEVLLSLNNEQDALSKSGGDVKELSICEPFILDNEEDADSFPATDFVDRGVTFNAFSSFIEGSRRIFYLEGFKGIGKTAFIEQLFKSKYRNINPLEITATKGMSFERFIIMLSEKISFEFDPKILLREDNKTQEFIIEEIMRSKQFVVIEQAQFLIARNGDFNEQSIGQFIYRLLKETSNLRIIFITDSKLQISSKFNELCYFHTMGPLGDRYINRIIENCLRSLNIIKTVETPKIPKELIEMIAGHPLAAIICSTLNRDYTFEEIVYDVKLKARFRDRILKSLLQKNELNKKQTDVMCYLALFINPAPVDFIEYTYGSEAYEIIDSLQSLFLLHKSDNKLTLHPLVRDYYVQKIFSSLTLYHNEIANYIKLVIERQGFITKPQILADLIYHSAQAGTELQVNEYLKVFKEEIRPGGILAYKLRNYTVAKSYFEVLIGFDEEDWDAHYRLALCYCKMEIPDLVKARQHFSKSTQLKPDGWWIYQSFGSAIIWYAFDEAESYINMAYDMAPTQPSVLSSMGRIILKRKNPDVALGVGYYRSALHYRPYDLFIYQDLIRQLLRLNVKTDAQWYLNRALKIDPNDPQLLEIREQLSRDTLTSYEEETDVDNSETDE